MSLEELIIDESTPEGKAIIVFNIRRLERYKNRRIQRRPSRKRYVEVKQNQLDRIELKLDLLLNKDDKQT